MRSERRSLLRLRGEGGEGLRRRRGGLRLLSLRRESRCLNGIGLLARLCGDDLLGLDLRPHDTMFFTQSYPQEPKSKLCGICTLFSRHRYPLHPRFVANKALSESESILHMCHWSQSNVKPLHEGYPLGGNVRTWA